MQGMGAVASVSVLIDGLECPREYRWYRITNETIRTGHSDDYASISEVIGARFTSGMVGEGGGGKRPDLLMIDGGRGQLHSAMAALKAANATDTPVVALAKQREEIWSPISSSPLPLPPNEPACMLLRLCRDEAHALALYYHRYTTQDWGSKPTVCKYVLHSSKARAWFHGLEFRPLTCIVCTRNTSLGTQKPTIAQVRIAAERPPRPQTLNPLYCASTQARAKHRVFMEGF